MTDGPAVVVVDPVSTGAYLAAEFRARSWQPIAVLSSPSLPDFYTSTLRPDDFVTVIDHAGDLDATAKRLRAHRAVAVMAGAEPGVELADALAARLGVPGNDLWLSAARRDKYAMARVVGERGLRVPATEVFTTPDEVVRWADRIGWPVVVKPRRSAGSDGVYFCADPAAARSAVRALVGHTSRLGEVNETVCVQRLVIGQQYFVNTTSRGGRHLIGEIWKDTRRHMPGHSLVYDHCDLLPPDGDVQRELTACVPRVLDALGIRWGPAHSEFVWTDAGPVLIEVGARLEGTIVPGCVQAALCYSHVTRAVDVVTDPAAQVDDPLAGYRLRRRLRTICLIAPHDGVITDPDLLSAASVPTLAGIAGDISAGRPVRRTIDLFTSPATLYLLADTDDELVRDTARVRELEATGLYAPVPADR